MELMTKVMQNPLESCIIVCVAGTGLWLLRVVPKRISEYRNEVRNIRKWKQWQKRLRKQAGVTTAGGAE